MERRTIAVVLVLALLAGSYVVAGGLGDSTDDPPNYEELDRAELVQPAENGSYLWPYTSRDRSVAGRTLAINVIIHGDDDRVHRALTARSELDWEESDPDEHDAEDDTYEFELENGTIEWDDAHGSTRYSYIDAGPNGGEPSWVDESYQLHAGTYLGSRQHIRAYTPPEDEWTAVQIHGEYWDWFRLRHTVTEIQESRNTLEDDFIGQPYVDEVRREHHGVDRGWNDGWLSVIELTAVLPVSLAALLGIGSIVSADTKRAVRREGTRLFRWSVANVRGFILAGSLAGLFIGVRSLGIALESAFPGTSPKTFVAMLYPVVALGPLFVTIMLAQPFHTATRFLRAQRIASILGRPIEPLPAFGFAVVGLGTAFVLDFAALGITAIPIELVLHRLGLLLALGLLAAGAARGDADNVGLFFVGLASWIVGLLLPLLGYL